jgi:GNAT superfamily N-acetyltransferase
MLRTNLALARKYTYGRETYSEIVPDLRPILEEHWKELALYDDIPLDPDYGVYNSLEQAGVLRVYTVRHSVEGLVGYAVYFVRRHHHYKRHTWAISDVILVRSAHRNAGVGNALFDFLERALKAEGVDVIHTMTKAAHPELAYLLEARGHIKAEVCYSLRL